LDITLLDLDLGIPAAASFFLLIRVALLPD
jgi:hypothetical protein